MKNGLTLIKDEFQTQINPRSVDLSTTWKISLSFVQCYSQESIRIRELVHDHILKAIDFYIGILNFHSEFSFLTNQIN